MFNLASLRHLLMLDICNLAKLPMISELFLLIEIMICFLDRPLVVMLILGLAQLVFCLVVNNVVDFNNFLDR